MMLILPRLLQLMHEYILDRFNPIIAAVFAAILEIADADIEVLAERESGKQNLRGAPKISMD